MNDIQKIVIGVGLLLVGTLPDYVGYPQPLVWLLGVSAGWGASLLLRVGE